MISDRIHELLGFLANGGPLVYLIAVIAAVIEGAAFFGLIFPSETILLIAGATTIHPDVRLSLLIPLVTAGAVVGDSIGYFIGERLGPRLRTSRMGRKVPDASWQRAEDLLHQRGWLAVMFGRFAAVLRALTPALAGTMGMRYSRFLAGNLLGAVIWTPLVLIVGHYAAHNLKGVEQTIRNGGWSFLALIALLSAAIYLRIRRNRSRNRVSD